MFNSYLDIILIFVDLKRIFNYGYGQNYKLYFFVLSGFCLQIYHQSTQLVPMYNTSFSTIMGQK
jgi:hypothetical protein